MGFFNKKPKFEGQGTCIWINEVGSIQVRVFNVVNKGEGRVKIDFGNNETYLIKESHLRAKRCIIYKKSDGKVVIQDPNKWRSLDLKKYGIKELRFNLQNFAIQEGRSSIQRWTLPPDRMSKLSSLFKLLMICITIGVLGWAAFKGMTYILDVVMSARLLDCSAILPKAQVPIGAIVSNLTNATAPLGA